MVTINRGPGTKLIEAQMVTLVAVTREPEGLDGRVLNEATGKIEKVDADTLIYRGYCVIATILTDDKELTIGEMPTDLNGYKILLPRTSASVKRLAGDPNAVRPGDTLTVVSSENNPGLPGIVMTVGTVEDATHPLYRRIQAREETDSPNNPDY